MVKLKRLSHLLSSEVGIEILNSQSQMPWPGHLKAPRIYQANEDSSGRASFWGFQLSRASQGTFAKKNKN